MERRTIIRFETLAVSLSIDRMFKMSGTMGRGVGKSDDLTVKKSKRNSKQTLLETFYCPATGAEQYRSRDFPALWFRPTPELFPGPYIFPSSNSKIIILTIPAILQIRPTGS